MPATSFVFTAVGTYTVVSGPATISSTTVTLTLIGLVPLRASEAADTNYAASSRQVSFSVARAQLTVTANNVTRYYGAANPAFTGSVAARHTVTTKRAIGESHDHA